jgi:CubicO group peptidase (beta-lactamase class C family)
MAPLSADGTPAFGDDSCAWHRDAASRARSVLAERLEQCRKATGAVVALVDRDRTTVVTFGTVGLDDLRPVDEHTVYELGSIQKVLDALALADMVRRGEIALDDPVERHLPADVRLPRRGAPITLLHLVTHTSGLPGRRTNSIAEECAATLDGVREFLESHVPARPPGAGYEYSNVGAQLLRFALAMRAGMGYETLLRTRVCAPLGMDSTMIAPTPALAARMAVGHNDRLQRVPNDEGVLKSSAADLSRLLRACLVPGAPLHDATASMLSPRVPIGAGVAVALGWNVETHGRDEIVCHDGLSRGYRTFIGFRPTVGRGVVVLMNAASTAGAQDLGYHLLDQSYALLTPDVPLLQPPTTPVGIAVPAEVLDAHVGRYQLTPNLFVTITRVGDRLCAEKTDRPRLELHAESDLEFFCSEVEFWELPADTRVLFRRGADGSTCGMTLRQRGQEVWLPRVREEGSGGVWFGAAPVAIDPRTLARYVGRYRLRSALLAVTQEGDRLVAEFDAGLRAQLVPSGDDTFFIPNDISRVQIQFQIDAQGDVVGVTAAYDSLADSGPRLP